MDSLLHRDSDHEQTGESDTPRGDREITLGATMILAIFFALAVFAAIFFGFGYSMGSRRTASALPAPATEAQSGVGAVKPAAGTLAKNPSAGRPQGDAGASSPAQSGGREEPAPAVRAEAPPGHAADSSSGAAALPGAQQPVVQIAAVSHQEDADLLLSALKRRGYAVSVRKEPHDQLLHVQVGPFASHKDAEAMRQRLIGDGFNAIVKDSGH